MIIHCTKKLSTKLGKPKLETQNEIETEVVSNPMLSWHAHLCEFDKKDCVLFTNDSTRYSIFIPSLSASNFEHIDQCFKDMLMASLYKLGVADKQLMHVELALGKIKFDSHTNPSVMGSMKNLKRMISQRIESAPSWMDSELIELNKWLTEIPMKGKDIGGYILPDREMKALIATLH